MLLRKKTPTAPQRPVTQESLKAWLVESLAQRLSLDAAEIDTSRNFEDYGLDSRTGIQLSGQLEKVLEHRLSPALLYHHTTIDAVVEHLAKQFKLIGTAAKVS
uniref:Putative acyl carrier protein n=1 Tax=symbiont bacterium of Paederus fuscipes TaxID=176282 RepID=Q6VT92_UNCXX|nr:putative acyl carrier protein [symbiont bacterium of Paederus fuscipes]